MSPAGIFPQLAVLGGRAALDFYAAAFGATVVHQIGGTDAEPSVVAELEVDGARFWVADEAPEHGTFSPESVGGATVRLTLVVDDPDALVARAVAAGATLVTPVGEEYGWRLGQVRDPFGHAWDVGHPLH